MESGRLGVGREMPVTKSPRSREGWGLAALLALVFVSYGRIWSRGGYSDDFYLLSYSCSQSCYAAARHWTQEFNSRVSHGLIVPLLYKGLSGGSPAAFHWAALHGLGLLAFGLSVFVLDRVLATLEVPGRARTVANLIFVLHPIKTEALLWPAAMTLYVIPLLFFLSATWLYLRNAKQGRETVSSLILPLCLFLFATFSVEQFFPLFAIVLAIRMCVYRSTKKMMYWNFVGFASISAILATLVIYGATARRLGHHGWIGLASIPTHLLELVSVTVAGFIGYRHRTLLDGHHQGALFKSLTTGSFLLGLILLGVVVWQLWNRETTSSKDSLRRSMVTMALGGLILIATLSPFLVINYGLSPRALYIPLLGVALMAGATMELLCGLFSRGWQKTLLVAGLLGIGIGCLVINSYDQDDFSRYWSMEKELVRQLQSAEDGLPPQGRVTLLYVPRPRSLAPSLVNEFAFPKLLDWISPAKHLVGSALTDLSEIFRLPPDLTSGEIIELRPPANHWVLLWSDREHRIIRLTGLRVKNYPTATSVRVELPSVKAQPDTGIESRELDAYLAPLSTRTPSESKAVIEVGWMIELPQLDLASFRVRVRADQKADSDLRLVVRVDYDDGSREYAYESVAPRWGFVESEGTLQRSIFVGRISRACALEMSLKDQGGVLSTLLVPLPGHLSHDR